MMVSNAADLLIKEFGDKKIKTSKEYLDKYGRDWYKGIEAKPSAIFFPENEKDISDLIIFANKHKHPIVPSGGRTGLNGGATAANNEIVVSSEKLNKIEWLSDANQIKCQSGVITDNAKEFALENNRLLPISFSATSSSTIGGNLATNAAGAKFIRYGATKEHVASMKVVLASGELIELRKDVLKDATGPNLMELFFGSEGTLGFITEITLNTFPLPAYTENILINFNDINLIQEEILKTNNKNIISAVEFWDSNCQKLFNKEKNDNYEVLIELAADSEAEINKCLEDLANLNAEVSLLNSKQTSELWSKREEIPVKLADLNAYKLDICVPIKNLKSYLDEIYKIDLDKEVYCFGHLGDGNVHVNIVSDTNLEELKSKIYDLTISLNGSPSAEHGIGQRKKHIWADFSYYSDKLKLLESLKKSMDPNNILCPKVFFD